MRGLRNFFVSILSAIIIVVLAIFAVQNLQGITTRFLGFTFTPNVWWVSIGSAVLGFILALLILAPGRIATGWRARRLDRERYRTEQEMSILRQEHESLRAQHAHIQAEREGLQTERDQLRARLAAAHEERAPVAGSSTAYPVSAGATDGYGEPDAPTSYRGDETVYAPRPHRDGTETVTQPDVRTDTRAEPAEPAETAEPAGQRERRHSQLGVGGRLRGMFSRPREETGQGDQGWSNDQPPAPTA